MCLLDSLLVPQWPDAVMSQRAQTVAQEGLISKLSRPLSSLLLGYMQNDYFIRIQCVFSFLLSTLSNHCMNISERECESLWEHGGFKPMQLWDSLLQYNNSGEKQYCTEKWEECAAINLQNTYCKCSMNLPLRHHSARACAVLWRRVCVWDRERKRERDC